MPNTNPVPLSPNVAVAVANLLSQVHATVNMLLTSADNLSVAPRPAEAHPPEAQVPVLAVNPNSDSSSDTGLRAFDQELTTPKPVKWYVVLTGREPGVYRGSHGIADNLKGIPGNQHEIFASESEALEFYENALRNGRVVRVNIIHEVLPSSD